MNILNKNVNGIILLDKPSNISSNNILQKIKKIFNAKKAGHTGTLDFLATGMLPICFGEATKFSQYLLFANKRYHVIAKLGESTNTFDSEGKITKIRSINFNKNELLSKINIIKNKCSQKPPIFSSLKYCGKPLYKYAYKNINIEIKERYIKIYELKLLSWHSNQIQLEILCSKGTYIRSLINDLGELLGCGAHIKTLRRLTIANFSYENMVTFNKIQNILNQNKNIEKIYELLLPIDSGLTHIPAINLSLEISNQIKLGKQITLDNNKINNLVRLTTGKNKNFFGIGKINELGKLISCRLVNK